MESVLSSFSDIIRATDSPIAMLALLALLVASLAYLFFKSDHVSVRLGVFFSIFFSAFVAGYAAIGGGSTPDDKSKSGSGESVQPVCENPVFNLGKGSECGVASYISKASEHCGVLEYKSGRGAECGIEQYHLCESGSCGWNSCGPIRKCDAKECRTVACGVERYMVCKHPNFGTIYKTCVHPDHGVDEYNQCRNKAFGLSGECNDV